MDDPKPDLGAARACASLLASSLATDAKELAQRITGTILDMERMAPEGSTAEWRAAKWKDVKRDVDDLSFLVNRAGLAQIIKDNLPPAEER